jgi:hypothetical protein
MNVDVNQCRNRLRRRKGLAFGPLRALAPPLPSRLRNGVFEKKTPLGEQVNDDEKNHSIRVGEHPAGSCNVCGSCRPRLSD